MTVIPQKQLRNEIGDVLRRAEQGERFTVTVSGRPVAEVGPARPRQWVSGAALGRVWETPEPQTLAADLEGFPAALDDPFAA